MWRWGFSSGTASLLEGKSQGLCLVQLCAKYRLVSIAELKKKIAFHKVKGSLYSCLLTACLPSWSEMLNWNLETIYTKVTWLSWTMTMNGSKHCCTTIHMLLHQCLVPNPSILSIFSPFVHFYMKAEWTQIRAPQTREGRMNWDRIVTLLFDETAVILETRKSLNWILTLWHCIIWSPP